MTLSAGARLGPYEVLAPLGAGGMGEVYRGRDTRLGREVALKVLPATVASDPERLRRFETEAQSASSLNHPNIVTVYDIGVEGGVSYLAMELVDGRTLREVLLDGPLPNKRLLSIAGQVAEGLARAHASGIVHRDLKPDNIMVTPDGLVKILDFGLAKVVPPSEAGEVTQSPTVSGTEPGLILGTVGYMSPEQASGKPLDFRSDQFAFGAIAYEMATGRRAFQRGSAPETLSAILRDDPESIAALAPKAPAPVHWIVDRCLSKDPRQRYGSTEDLARDLAAVRERLLDAPQQARAARPSQLPAQRTAFVGRERERASARELLRRSDVALVTLTGPPGIGKTRLGLQLAEELQGEFPGGVYYVPLAPLGDPELVAATIAQSLVAAEGGHSPLEALTEYLRDPARQDMLLVLDGFEHLTPAAPLVADLAAAGPRLKILVTSRSPLHIYGEHEFPVPAMATPDPRSMPPVDQLSRYEAIALFVQRAIAVKPDFAMTADKARDVVEICARLDGLPLAIELAASRVKLLPPSALRARLEKSLQLLTGGARDLPARQQTLRGAIDWSHGLLTAEEQKLFRRLAVFAGGCTLEAAEAVCNAKEDLGLDVFEGMASLVDKSLLQQVETEGGEPRFVMLGTIREYASERLAAGGDEPLTRRAHAAYFLVVAEEAGSEQQGESRQEWAPRLDVEHDNFRAALDWLTANSQAEWGLRLGAALFQFWEVREHLAEGRSRLAALLAVPGAEKRTKARARALFSAGVLAGEQGDYAAAQALLGESLGIHRELGDQLGVAVLLNALAVEAREFGELAAARSLSEENLERWRELGDRRAVARALSNLASVALAQGDLDRARALDEESVSIFRELGDQAGAAWALSHRGDVARAQGDAGAARSFYDASLTTFRDLGDRWGVAAALADLGNLARDQKDASGAAALYRESLAIFAELEHKRGIARLLECFAAAAAADGRAARALTLAGSAASLREALGAPLPRVERSKLDASLEPARQKLSDAESAAAWMEGWAMPVEKAVASALDGEEAASSR